jgi:integrase
VDAGTARATIGELGALWLANQSHLKPSSFRPVESAWRRHVRPVWGERRVGTIRHSEVQTWVTALAAGNGKPLSATMVRRAYGVLASILETAVRDRRILSNPAKDISLPKKTNKPRRYLTHGQVQLLADGARAKGTLVLFLAYTGLRWGEATGLRVRNLDMLRRRLTVEENAVNVGGHIVVGTPKSGQSRTVPFPAFLAELLARQGEGKDRDQLVFGDGQNHLRSPDVRDGWFVNAKKRARAVDPTFPDLTLHDLRHTAASLAVSSGANVKAVQRMLGHASAAMTLDTYADLFDTDLDAVGEALDRARTQSVVGEVWGKGPSARTATASLPRKRGDGGA